MIKISEISVKNLIDKCKHSYVLVVSGNIAIFLL